MALKIKWKVSCVPAGRYRSFENRSWPSGQIDDHAVAHLSSDVSYSATLAQDSGEHNIHLSIADWSNYNSGDKIKSAFVWKRLKQTFKTVAAAKAAAVRILQDNPSFLRKAEVK